MKRLEQLTRSPSGRRNAARQNDIRLSDWLSVRPTEIDPKHNRFERARNLFSEIDLIRSSFRLKTCLLTTNSFRSTICSLRLTGSSLTSIACSPVCRRSSSSSTSKTSRVDRRAWEIKFSKTNEVQTDATKISTTISARSLLRVRFPSISSSGERRLRESASSRRRSTFNRPTATLNDEKRSTESAANFTERRFSSTGKSCANTATPRTNNSTRSSELTRSRCPSRWQRFFSDWQIKSVVAALVVGVALPQFVELKRVEELKRKKDEKNFSHLRISFEKSSSEFILLWVDTVVSLPRDRNRESLSMKQNWSSSSSRLDSLLAEEKSSFSSVFLFARRYFLNLSAMDWTSKKTSFSRRVAPSRDFLNQKTRLVSLLCLTEDLFSSQTHQPTDRRSTSIDEILDRWRRPVCRSISRWNSFRKPTTSRTHRTRTISRHRDERRSSKPTSRTIRRGKRRFTTFKKPPEKNSTKFVFDRLIRSHRTRIFVSLLDGQTVAEIHESLARLNGILETMTAAASIREEFVKVKLQIVVKITEFILKLTKDTTKRFVFHSFCSMWHSPCSSVDLWLQVRDQPEDDVHLQSSTLGLLCRLLPKWALQSAISVQLVDVDSVDRLVDLREPNRSFVVNHQCRSDAEKCDWRPTGRRFARNAKVRLLFSAVQFER